MDTKEIDYDIYFVTCSKCKIITPINETYIKETNTTIGYEYTCQNCYEKEFVKSIQEDTYQARLDKVLSKFGVNWRYELTYSTAIQYKYCWNNEVSFCISDEKDIGWGIEISLKTVESILEDLTNEKA